MVVFHLRCCIGRYSGSGLVGPAPLANHLIVHGLIGPPHTRASTNEGGSLVKRQDHKTAAQRWSISTSELSHHIKQEVIIILVPQLQIRVNIDAINKMVSRHDLGLGQSCIISS
jgi:hypothetical protein